MRFFALLLGTTFARLTHLRRELQLIGDRPQASCSPRGVPFEVMLPPTTEELRNPEHRPYFLWWLDATVADLRRQLASQDVDTRAYWMGALLREANSRDVWLFVTVAEIQATWPHLTRYLGRSRARWAWLLELPLYPWPPPEAHARSV